MSCYIMWQLKKFGNLLKCTFKHNYNICIFLILQKGTVNPDFLFGFLISPNFAEVLF